MFLVVVVLTVARGRVRAAGIPLIVGLLEDGIAPVMELRTAMLAAP